MKCGDIRLSRRGESLVRAIMNKQSVILRKICRDRNEEIGFGRFLRNEKVTPAKMLAPVFEKTSGATAGKDILLIQDTSTLNFGLSPIAGEMPMVGNFRHKQRHQGFYVHPTIALDASNGNCLGLASCVFFEHKVYPADSPMNDAAERKRMRNKIALEEKESYRWVEAALSAQRACAQAKTQLVIADQESDAYAILARLQGTHLDFLIRTRGNRKLTDGTILTDYLKSQPVQHSFTLGLPGTDKRSAHVAELDLKWGLIPLNATKVGHYKRLPKHLEMTVIEVTERPESVVNNEAPICWRLLFSREVASPEQALEAIRFYCYRWVIEQLFRSLKSKGLAIEEALVETQHGLKNLTAAALVAAVRVIQLVQARDGSPNMKSLSVFSKKERQVLSKVNKKVEGRTEKLKNPHPRTTLAFASWAIARLGGWSGYKSQKPPGPITMARGLKRFNDMVFLFDF